MLCSSWKLTRTPSGEFFGRRKARERTGVNPFYRFMHTFDDEDVIY
jgi:hypothetical protein